MAVSYSGVLMLDDDHLYATRDVEFAFRVWKVREYAIIHSTIGHHITQ